MLCLGDGGIAIVITVGNGWVLLASATSTFSGYLPTAPLQRRSSSSEVSAVFGRSWA